VAEVHTHGEESGTSEADLVAPEEKPEE